MTDEIRNQPRRVTIGGTSRQQLTFLNVHWGSKYSFSAPQESGDRWTATAKFGQHDQIQQDSATELLEEVRAHYQVNWPKSAKP